MASVKVAVRVRPFNSRETKADSKLVVGMNNNKTILHPCQEKDGKNSVGISGEKARQHDFTFDHSYWSTDPQDPNFHPQSRVFTDLGLDVVENAFGGYNVCVFAYGQTGSGKTYTMMGTEKDRGLIPRICETMFQRMSTGKEEGTSYRTEVSYLEIYNEKVKDLLNFNPKKTSSHNLKVREHPTQGPYVEDLSKHLVMEYRDILKLMEEGNNLRTTASTNMNDTSSRSHAIFTITFVQAGYLEGMPHETKSKIHLVDLAGSERANATGASGQRLKEGAHINKSLVTLGSVISALAEASVKALQTTPHKQVFVPYRDSVLTWLLKDSLGGNSKTIMIATISPADINHGETLSTLRYANRAKNIINKPTINEDANVRLIRELRQEIDRLKCIMSGDPEILANMQEQLAKKEAQEQQLTHEWNEKWREAAKILKEHNALGLKRTGIGVALDSDKPHLIGLDEDILSTGITLYQLREGDTVIGSEEEGDGPHISLNGPCISPLHCTIRLEGGVATLVPAPGALCIVNASPAVDPVRLSQGCVIVLGKTNMFRYNDPLEAANLRKNMSEKTRKASLMNQSLLSQSLSDLSSSRAAHRNSGDFKMFASDGDIKDIAEVGAENVRQESTDSVNTLIPPSPSGTSTASGTPRLGPSESSTPRVSKNKMEELNLESKQVTSLQRHLDLGHSDSGCASSDLDSMVCSLVSGIDSMGESTMSGGHNSSGDSVKFDLNANPAINSTQIDNGHATSSCSNDTISPVPRLARDTTPSSVDESSVSATPMSMSMSSVAATPMSVTTPSDAGCSDSESTYPASHASSSMGGATAALSQLYQEICDQKDVIMACLEEDNCDINQLNAQIAKLQGMQNSYSKLELESAKSLWASQGGEDQGFYQDRFAVIVESEVERRLEAELDMRAETERQERELLLLEREQEMERLRHQHEREMYLMKKKLSKGNLGQVTEPTSTTPIRHRSPNGCSFQVNLPRFKSVGQGSQSYVEYEVEVCILEADVTWRLYRRFSKFRELHVQLSHRYGEVIAKLPFPSRKLFGSKSETVSSERQKELQTYLNRLIATGCKISTSPLYTDQTRESLARFSPFFLTTNSDDLHFS